MLFLINNAGVPSVAKFVQVSAAPTDVPPTGTITAPATDVTIPQGRTVTFAGSGTATTGAITGYSWSIRGGSPATSSMQNPGAVTFATPGTYQATLTVTDTAGITDPNPPVVTITVTPVSPAPTLASAAPASGAQAQTNLNVVLTGTNFLANPVCSFGAGIEVNSCTFNSATQLTANVDVLASAAVGPRNIVVTDTDTQTATLANGFSVVAGTALPAPTLTAITPNAEFQGTTNATVTLTGTNFQPAPTCNFDSDFGGTVNTCTFVSPTQINVNLNVAPTATLGGHNVSVTNADGQSATIINGFTVAENLGNTVQLGTGFTAGAMVMNGNAQLNGSVLELTDGNQFEASSAWYATRVNVQNFVTDFTFQVTPGTTADGFTFALQANSTAALGVAGGPLGYGQDSSTGTGGIPNSVAVKFDLYDNFGEGIDSTGLYINGASPTIPFVDMTGSGIDLHSGDIFDVHMTYDGTSLIMTITDTVTNAVFTHSLDNRHSHNNWRYYRLCRVHRRHRRNNRNAKYPDLDSGSDTGGRLCTGESHRFPGHCHRNFHCANFYHGYEQRRRAPAYQRVTLTGTNPTDFAIASEYLHSRGDSRQRHLHGGGHVYSQRHGRTSGQLAIHR